MKKDIAKGRLFEAVFALQNPQAFLEFLGQAISKSQFIKCPNTESGIVIATICVIENMSPLEFDRTYHMIAGRPTMKYDAMLAGLVNEGLEYEVLRRDPEEARLRVTSADKKHSQEFSMTIEDAQQESWFWGKPQNGKQVPKDNWKAPRSRMQMLFARVVSDAVRTMASGVVSGIYTPEEMADITGTDLTGSSSTTDIKWSDDEKQPDATPQPSLPSPEPVAATAPPPKAETPKPEVPKTEVPKTEAPKTEAAKPEPSATVSEPASDAIDPASPGSITELQIDRLRSMFGRTGCTHQKQEEILKKRGCSALHNLSGVEAEKLIAKLVEMEQQYTGRDEPKVDISKPPNEEDIPF